LEKYIHTIFNRNIKITIEPAPAIPNLEIITIKGTIDSVTYKQVDKEVLSVMEKEESNVILDLSNMVFLSSVGIMCLINYLTFMTNKKKLLKLVKPPQSVYKMLEATGIAKHFDMYDSIEAALSSF
jgi:anti-anti-sigma factor